MWDETAEGEHARLLALSRDLAGVRRARAELTDPAFGALSATCETPDAAPEARRFTLRRGALSVLVNLSAEPWDVPLPADGDTVPLATADAIVEDGEVTVAPNTAVVTGSLL